MAVPLIAPLKAISGAQWAAALLLSVVLCGWIAYQLPVEKYSAAVIDIPFDVRCDLRSGPCETLLSDGARVGLSIEPLSIPVDKPLQISVQVSGLQVQRVTVDINGVDMKMPINPLQLEKVADGRYVGIGNLSFCSQRLMEWEALVSIDTGGNLIKLPYRFITQQSFQQ